MDIVEQLENGVMYITLNRPESLNSFTKDMLLALYKALGNAEKAGARAVVLTGAGRAFCAGQDLKSMEGQKINFTEHVETTYNKVVNKMCSMEIPVITAVNGAAAGAGASIALAGDIRIFSSSAKFMEAFSNIALIPDSGSTWFLPRLVGYNKAFELMAMAEVLDAEACKSLGLCEHVYAAENFMEQVKVYAEKLAARPTRALGLTKRCLNYAQNHSLPESLQYEAYVQEIAGNLHDHHEGVNAFKEKRLPQFKGA